ncbi:PREDICTED: translation initiation factor IF-2-like [Rhinopithecus bieti]|uniref:translation initiation factor IF-2-like n=1 Tax=Rhinopithecus bieti TaxID=61621 RepID=UPI00083C50AD|nr:PREDICTED: translation initiation factor IF-2-like [Rhinopithecus bieti]
MSHGRIRSRVSLAEPLPQGPDPSRPNPGRSHRIPEVGNPRFPGAERGLFPSARRLCPLPSPLHLTPQTPNSPSLSAAPRWPAPPRPHNSPGDGCPRLASSADARDALLTSGPIRSAVRPGRAQSVDSVRVTELASVRGRGRAHPRAPGAGRAGSAPASKGSSRRGSRAPPPAERT